jgi:hypothetical protein
MESVVDVLINASQIHISHWTLYVVVVTAVLGYSFSDSYQVLIRRDGKIRYALLFVLILFMLVNLFSIYFNAEIYNAAVSEIKKTTDEHLLTLASSFTGIPISLILVIHVLFDFIVLSILYHRIPVDENVEHDKPDV